MAYTYATWLTALANELVVAEDSAPFVAIVPTIIDYAEQRCYRDLDLIYTTERDATGTLSANTRTGTVPTPSSGVYRVIDQINVLQSGSRTPLTPSSQEVIDMLWPSSTAASSSTIPSMYAMVTATTFIVGPPPGSSLSFETVGKIRPNPLTAINTTTILTTYFPDLFFAASMISGTGWQQNYGAQGDDPRSAMSWSQQYDMLLKSADTENQRAKFGGASWTSKPIMTQALPQRG